MTLLDVVLAVLFGATVIIITAQVVWRYALNSPLTWSEEISRFLFAWIVFLGAAAAVREGTHIRIDLFVDRLPRGVSRALRGLSLVLTVALFGLVAVVGFWYVVHTQGTTSAALRWPVNLVHYAALPVASVLAAVFAIMRLVAAIRARRGDDGPEDQP